MLLYCCSFSVVFLYFWIFCFFIYRKQSSRPVASKREWRSTGDRLLNEKDRKCLKNTRQNSSVSCPRWVFPLARACAGLFFVLLESTKHPPPQKPTRFLLNQERRWQLNSFVYTGHIPPSLTSLPPSFPPNYHLTCTCSYRCLRFCLGFHQVPGTKQIDRPRGWFCPLSLTI